MNKLFLFILPIILFFNCAKKETDNKKFSLLALAYIMNQNNKLPIYINFVSHNEESTSAGDPDYAVQSVYVSSRNLVKQMADTIYSKGGKWNYQSDWKFLLSIKNYEPNGSSDINNKNLIRYLKEDKNFEVDPHAHETTYNYADVAKLISDLGVEPSKNVGGFVYDETSATKTWERMQNSLSSSQVSIPSYSWKPETLWGAASKSHTNDDKSFGAWKPKSPTEFTTHDSTKNLGYMGSGCKNLVTSTSKSSDHIAVVKKVIDNVQNGTYPKTGFYPITIMMNQRDFSANTIQTVSDILDGLKEYSDKGYIQWKTITEKKSIWINSFKSENTRIPCD
ncbi:MAG: hypothetical protein SFU98_08535 [Leptospiraceae bacterium]|nr:hypothetical protein [Leptospiraceae bacterium]